MIPLNTRITGKNTTGLWCPLYTSTVRYFDLVLPPEHDTFRNLKPPSIYFTCSSMSLIDEMQLLPWGGKITSESLRFFSPIVIWTVFEPREANQQALYSAFVDYYMVCTHFFFFVFKFYLCWYWFPLFSTCRSGLSSWTEQFAKVAKKKSTAIEKRNINISHGEQRRFGRSFTRKESFVPCNKRSYYILDCTIEFLLLTSSSLPKKQNKILLLSWCPSYLCIHEIQPVPCFLDHFSGSWVPAAKEVDRWEWCQGWWSLPCNQWNS